MEEIKFRGIYPQTGELMDVCCIDWMHDEVHFEQGSDVGYPIDQCKLMQFTGLRDRKGVECYEGYIIKAHKNTYIVKHGEFTDVCVLDSVDCDDPDLADQYGWFLQDISRDDGDGESLRGLEKHCEIVGNIHQHPHLLEQQA